MKKILFLLVLLCAMPASAVTYQAYGKSGGGFEIAYLHPTSALCTRVARSVSSNAKGQAIRFDSMSPSDGCKAVASGIVPNWSGSSYQLTVRLYYTTAVESLKVVELGVRAYAVVPSGGTGANVERITTSTQVVMNSGGARDFIADQNNYIEGTVTVKTQANVTCTSACNNQELILLIEPTANMTVPAGEFYLTDFRVSGSF